MSKNWDLVPLHNVLTHRKEFIIINDIDTYKRCRVQCNAKGIILRDQIKGIEIKTKKQQICKTGEFLVAEIDAKMGGFGIVPKELDGAIVSSHYFLYSINKQKLNERFLHYFVKTPYFLEQVNAQGSTNYAAIRPNDVLSYKISLPPLEEQRRIVEKIERLAGKIEEVRSLRLQTIKETEKILASAMNDIWGDQNKWNTQLMGDVVQTVCGQVDPTIEPFCNLPHIGGDAIESGTCKLLSYRLAKVDGVTSGKYHFKEGSILYSKIRPYLRKAVQVPVEGICSADIYAFEYIAPDIEPRFLMYSLISDSFTKYANLLSGRTRMPKLNQKQLFGFPLKYPPLSEQKRIVEYLDRLQSKIEIMKKEREKALEETDALLPSILDKAFKGEL